MRMDSTEYLKMISKHKPKKTNKYHAKGVWCCPTCNMILSKGSTCASHKEKPIYFHSTGEWKRWVYLCSLQALKQITNLKRQIKFSLDVNGVHVANYTADFSYINKDNEQIVEDFKGVDTYASKLARKLTYAIHGVEVVIVKN